MTLVTVQVKVVVGLGLAMPSATVTVTVKSFEALPTTAVKRMVPLITPVVAWMLSPGGKPVALKVSLSPSGSLALSDRDTVAPSSVV